MGHPNEHNHDLTSLIARFSHGDRAAAESLLPLIYEELRRIAASHFRVRQQGHTLQPTALVNEAYLKLAESSKLAIRDRKHFFVLAASIMRQILVDHARAKQAQKRGGNMNRLTLDGVGEMRVPQLDLLALEEAMNRLTKIHPDRAKLVELRFFAGLTSNEAGEVLGISRSEAARQWRAARAWLTIELGEGKQS
ncbi:MAG: sigma-70 family RNA polymerase sigma factor [Phycisphaerales bacterium]|nr:MAG: sigma-70 family RNA polymerase sigma factor [Phycisphaerales bacterium]